MSHEHTPSRRQDREADIFEELKPREGVVETKLVGWPLCSPVSFHQMVRQWLRLAWQIFEKTYRKAMPESVRETLPNRVLSICRRALHLRESGAQEIKHQERSASAVLRQTLGFLTIWKNSGRHGAPSFEVTTSLSPSGNWESEKILGLHEATDLTDTTST